MLCSLKISHYNIIHTSLKVKFLAGFEIRLVFIYNNELIISNHFLLKCIQLMSNKYLQNRGHTVVNGPYLFDIISFAMSKVKLLWKWEDLSSIFVNSLYMTAELTSNHIMSHMIIRTWTPILILKS